MNKDLNAKIRTSVLINNYNYQDYLPAAIQSVLSQSQPPDEVIIVDDASTDASATILESFMNDSRVRVILKEKNEGQLACFNIGYAASHENLIFFLDADDEYKSNYLEEAVAFYQKYPTCDFLFCGYKTFGHQEDLISPYSCDRDLGYSVIAALYAKQWIGGVTSTLSMRRSILEKVLPIPSVNEWKSRADDCLIFGASVVGAKKFYINQHLVKYRIHAKNAFSGRTFNNDYNYTYSLNVYRLLSSLAARMHYTDEILKLAWLEFLTLPRPTLRELFLYTEIIFLSDIHWIRKFKGITSNIKHFFLSRFFKL